MTEKMGWVASTLDILRFVAGSAKAFHLVSVDSVTSVDIDRGMFPVSKNISSRNRSRSPTKRPRVSCSVASVTEEAPTARAGITVNVDLESKRVRDIRTNIQYKLGKYPTPFRTTAESPLITNTSCLCWDFENATQPNV
ncbi:hypothetical protein ABW19_dt0204156 [Dactylella cylindrospora]|nr:hypothetical protein ABW19_dt0204156 [Dactylella cylindrospora]